MILKQILTIQTGVFAKPSGSGELVYLQSKHFDDKGHLLSVLHPDLKAEGIAEKHLLKAGDVLFSAKGTKNFAAVFENIIEASVASTSFFVLRIFDKKLMPNYLAWLLNSHSIQLKLKKQAIGTSMPSISKQVIENLEIIVPSIDIQNTVLKIIKLQNEEKSLKQEIETLKEKKIQQIILSNLKNNL